MRARTARRTDFFRPFSIFNPPGRGVQFREGASNWVDTPFLQATTFEHEHEHEHERRTPNAKRLVSIFNPLRGCNSNQEHSVCGGGNALSPLRQEQQRGGLASNPPVQWSLVVAKPVCEHGIRRCDQFIGGRESAEADSKTPLVRMSQIFSPSEPSLLRWHSSNEKE
jgi:hypothetical protein